MSQELSLIEPKSAEIAAPIRTYDGIATLGLTKEQEEILQAPPDRDKVKKRPDGHYYVEGVHYRKRLDKAFGVGGWALKPLSSTSQPFQMMTNKGSRNEVAKEAVRVFVQGQLWCAGHFVSESVGEDIYYLDNQADSYATAWEKAKSNLLVRCCKELGIFRELWDKTWIDDTRKSIGQVLKLEHGAEASKPDIKLKGQVQQATQGRQAAQVQQTHSATTPSTQGSPYLSASDSQKIIDFFGKEYGVITEQLCDEVGRDPIDWTQEDRSHFGEIIKRLNNGSTVAREFKMH